MFFLLFVFVFFKDVDVALVNNYPDAKIGASVCPASVYSFLFYVLPQPLMP